MSKIDKIRERAKLLKEGDFFEGVELKQFPQDVINLCGALEEARTTLGKFQKNYKSCGPYNAKVTLARIDQILERK